MSRGSKGLMAGGRLECLFEYETVKSNRATKTSDSEIGHLKFEPEEERLQLKVS